MRYKYFLRWLDTLERFCQHLQRGTTFDSKEGNFCDLLFAFQYIQSFWKDVYSKRKEFAPNGSKFFPFRVGPFSEGRQNSFDR